MTIVELETYFRTHSIDKAEREKTRQNFELGDMFNLYAEKHGQGAREAGLKVSEISGYNRRVLETYGRIARRVLPQMRDASTSWSVFVYLASDLNPRQFNLEEPEFLSALNLALESVRENQYTFTNLKSDELGINLIRIALGDTIN